MATFTTNFNFGLPTVGGDKNAWGQFLNQNWLSIDTLLKTSTDTANAALPKAGGTMTGNATFSSGFTAILGKDPTASGEAATKNYVDTTSATLRSTAVLRDGSQSMTGPLTLPGDPTNATHSATKNYVDNQINTRLPLVGGTLTGNLTIQSGTTGMNINLGSAGRVYGTATELGFYNTAGTFSCKMTLANGDFTASGNVIAYSDAKLKTNVETIRDAVAIVNRMRGVFYDRIDTGVAQVGVIAQEMQEVLPQVVHSSDETLGVAYGNLTAVLIEAVKELSQRVAELEAR